MRIFFQESYWNTIALAAIALGGCSYETGEGDQLYELDGSVAPAITDPFDAEAAPEPVSVIRQGLTSITLRSFRLRFKDEREHFQPNNAAHSGSRRTSQASNAALGYAYYESHWRCPNGENGMRSGYASSQGTYQLAEPGCSGGEVQVVVRFETSPLSSTASDAFLRVSEIDAATSEPYTRGMKRTSPWCARARSNYDFNVSCAQNFGSSTACTTPDTTERHRQANIFATATDVVRVWGAYRGPFGSPTYVLVPTNDPSKTGAAAGGRDGATLAYDSWKQNHQVAHEMGHGYMKRALSADPFKFNGGSLGWGESHNWDKVWMSANSATDDRNGGADCTAYPCVLAACAPGSGPSCAPAATCNPEDRYTRADRYRQGNHDGWSETAATAEGWADFFAAATHFTPDADQPYAYYCDGMADCSVTSSIMRRMEGTTRIYSRYSSPGLGHCLGVTAAQFPARDTAAGGKNDPCKPLSERHPANADRSYASQGNIARFFWDLYDRTSDEPAGQVDSVTFSPEYMLYIWERFAAGYGNRASFEPNTSSDGWDDPDGRNAADYRKVECSIPESVANAYGAIGHCGAHTEFDFNCLTGQDESE